MSHGSRCRMAAEATRKGSWVCEATSSGPAASAIPSPTLLVHVEASSQRKGRPIRTGAIASMSLLTPER